MRGSELQINTASIPRTYAEEQGQRHHPSEHLEPSQTLYYDLLDQGQRKLAFLYLERLVLI